MIAVYNALFGANPDGEALLTVLNLTMDDVGRYRDAWITKDGEIAIHTRLGSGPRACYCDQTDEEKAQAEKEADERISKMFKNGLPSQKDLDENYYQTHKTFTPRKPHSEDITHEKYCWYPYVRRLQSHPLFIREEIEEETFDETTHDVISGDSTYATFFFKIPLGFERKISEIRGQQSSEYEKSHEQRFNELMENIEKMIPNQLEAEFPEVTGVVKKLNTLGSEKDDLNQNNNGDIV